MNELTVEIIETNLTLDFEQSLPGYKGWSPQFSVQIDGNRNVLRVESWLGGEGAAPPTGQYVGAAGFVSTASAAVDIRGANGVENRVQNVEGVAGATLIGDGSKTMFNVSHNSVLENPPVFVFESATDLPYFLSPKRISPTVQQLHFSRPPASGRAFKILIL
jgi:hypothetical protein